MDVKSTLLAAALATIALGASAGEVYKWVDPSGRTHYSDMPQPGWQRVDLNGSGGTPVTPAAREADQADQDEESVAAREKLRAEQCQRSKDKLESYKRANNIVERDTLGNEKVYTAEERLQLLAQTQKNVDDFCGAKSE